MSLWEMEPGEEKLRAETKQDPAPHERIYVRHHITGDRGYLVKRGGKDHVRLDRPNDDSTRPFHADEWRPDNESRPMTPAQIAQVAWEADQALLRFQGRATRNAEWMNLRDEARIAFVNHGPNTTEPLRLNLWKSVMDALRPLTQPGDK